MVTKDQAIEIATKELANSDRAPKDYEMTVDPEDTNQDFWMIWFERKGPYPAPGGRHAVRVNKNTGHADLMPGE